MKKENFYSINHTDSAVVINLNSECKVLSSAIYNGGFGKINSALIFKVEENFKGTKKEFEEPEATLQRCGKELKLSGKYIGMMTSALMNSFRESVAEKDGVIISAMITAGVSNAKRAGEKAEWQSFEHAAYATGTINIILYTNLNLTPAAMTETIMIITEAKAAVLQDLKIKTPDNNIATGTGTDSTAVVCEQIGHETKFCGKHTLLGEMIGKVVYRAVTSSLNKDYYEN